MDTHLYDPLQVDSGADSIPFRTGELGCQHQNSGSNAQLGQSRPPHITMASSSFSTVGWNNTQGTSLVQLNITEWEKPNENGSQGATGTIVYVGLELPWLPQLKMLVGDYDMDFNELPQPEESANKGGNLQWRMK